MRRLIVASMALVLIASCGREVGDEAPRTLRESKLDRPFVVFTQSEVLIQELESPVSPPVAVGSAPSQATLTSSDAGIVSVRYDGALVAHRAGVAVIHAPGGAMLRVEVVAPKTVMVADPRPLRPGESMTLALLADGASVDPSRAAWATSDPKVATVSQGVVRAGRSGSARIRARYAGTVAEARVEVAGAGETFSVVPSNPRVALGQVVAFQAVAERGSAAATWSATNDRVFAHLGGGVFEARARGRVRVCAEASQRVFCTNVEVVP